MSSKIIDKKEQLDFSEKIETELDNILKYWQANTIDHENGGFLGKIDNDNIVHKKAPKSIILNSRLLWTFSKACNHYNNSIYDEECMRAFKYLKNNFKDNRYGGVYWELDYLGSPVNKRKQIYAQAFTIYALAEYYKYSKNPEALVWANEIYDLIETRSLDKKGAGYLEAFNEDWSAIDDMRLSEKDLNAPKTTNTHLHILEAYTTLYEVGKNSLVKKSVQYLLELFINKIFHYNNHLKLFFTADWKNLSSEISYGHDIEAVWLMVLAARTIKDDELIAKTEKLHKEVSKTFINEALDQEFGVINAKDAATNELDSDRHWWPQAEAIVGLIYNWKITDDASYFSISQQIWEFTTAHIIDTENGEWFFRVDKEGVPYRTENKVGPWKCPYHNSRALMEVSKMIATG